MSNEDASIEKLKTASAIVEKALNKLLIIGHATHINIEVSFEILNVNDTQEAFPRIVITSE